MTNLNNLISEITQFAINPNVEIIDKEIDLKKLLVEIYLEFLIIDFELFTEEYPEPPVFNYDNIYKKVQSNFPNFGCYIEVLESNAVEPNIEIGIGDEIDDLADIIIDLLQVLWRLENTTINRRILAFSISNASTFRPTFNQFNYKVKRRKDSLKIFRYL